MEREIKGHSRRQRTTVVTYIPGWTRVSIATRNILRETMVYSYLTHCSWLVGTVNHRLTWSTIVVVKWSWEERLFLFWHGGLNLHHIVLATSSNDQWEDNWRKESEFWIQCDARIIQYQICLTLLLLYSVFINPKRNQDPMTIYRRLRHCVISPTTGKDIDYLRKWTGVRKTPSGN